MKHDTLEQMRIKMKEFWVVVTRPVETFNYLQCARRHENLPVYTKADETIALPFHSNLFVLLHRIYSVIKHK